MDQTHRNASGPMLAPMLDPEIVTRIRVLKQLGWGSKRIAREVGVARNSVRRYLRGGAAAERQTRPKARTLDGPQVETACALLDGAAEGNAVVVRRLLAQQAVAVPLRTLQRALAPHRQAKRAEALATVRFETPPGHQMQIDFGEKWVGIAGRRTKVHLVVDPIGWTVFRASAFTSRDSELCVDRLVVELKS